MEATDVADPCLVETQATVIDMNVSIQFTDIADGKSRNCPRDESAT